MGRLYGQATPTVLNFSGSMAAGASISGSISSRGYSTMVGGVYTSDSTIAACGIRVDQSFDQGQTWAITSASNALANNASAACSVTIQGDAIKVYFQNGITAASRVRATFYLKVF